MRTAALVCLVSLGLAVGGCATARPLVPVGAGRVAAELSVPGVLVRTDTSVFPVGAALVGARYGLADDLELRLRTHLFTLPKRIVGLEGGGVWHVRAARPGAPGLHVTGDASVLAQPGDTHVRGALALGVLGDLAVGHGIRPYLALEQALILVDGAYVLSAFGGVQLTVGRYEVSLETGVAGLNHRSREYTLPYVGLGGRGAVWVSWGLTYRFGEEDGS